MKLNGFTIDKYNQYGLKDKAKTSICPLCSADRKKKTDKCASLMWDTGLGHCHHCGETFQLHTYSKNTKPEKRTYKRPKFKNNTELSDKVVKWFSERKISQITLKEAKITEGKEWMPQTKKEENTIQFNYFRLGELINVKYRDARKNFKLAKDAELIFWNLDSIHNTDECFIVEGECFKGNAEILTTNGWCSFENYSGENVMQYNKGKGEFVSPVCFVKKEYNDDLIELSNTKKFYSITTKNHNILTKNNNNEYQKLKAIDIYNVKSKPNKIIRVLENGVNSKGLNLSNELIRLYIAISADFTIRSKGDIYGAFKKERKKQRFIEIADKLNLRYSIKKDKRNYWSIFIHRNQNLNPFKIFPNEWIGKLNNDQIKLIIDEILYWDGNSVPNRNQIEFSTKLYHNAKFIQTISHLAGYTSTIIRRKNDLGSWYKVSILFSKKYTSLQNSTKRQKVKHEGLVYCVQVPSGNIIVRQNECISISGNCDALALMEVGFKNVVSVPNGATKKNINLEYLDNCLEHFEDKKKIFLCGDKDEAGENLENELKRRLGIERCFYFDMNGCKDANEYLIKHGQIKLQETLKQPIPYPLDDVVTFAQDGEQFDDFWFEGMPDGIRIGLHTFDEIFRVDNEGRFIVVTGIPSHGKSEFVDQMIVGYNIKENWKTAYCSVENTPAVIHKAKVFKKIYGDKPTKDEIKSEKYKFVKDYFDDNFFFIDFKDGNYDLVRVLEKAKELIFRKGIKVFVIDPFNKVRLKKSLNKSITDYTNDYLSLIDEFCKKYKILIILVAHPKKMEKLQTGNRMMPDFYDIKGGGEFYDMSPFGLCVYRDFDNHTTIIKALKVKFEHLGENNEECVLGYDTKNGRYCCLDSSGAKIYNDNCLIMPETPQLEINIDDSVFSDFDNIAAFENSSDVPF